MERTLYVLPLLRVLVLLKRSKGGGQKRPLEKFRVLVKKEGNKKKERQNTNTLLLTF